MAKPELSTETRGVARGIRRTCIELDTLVAINTVYVIDGNDGDVIDEIIIDIQTECFYGGAMDGDDGFWIMEGYGYPHGLLRLDQNSSQYETRDLQCGYGISVDSYGRVWTGGRGVKTLHKSDSAPNGGSIARPNDGLLPK